MICRLMLFVLAYLPVKLSSYIGASSGVWRAVQTYLSRGLSRLYVASTLPRQSAMALTALQS